MRDGYPHHQEHSANTLLKFLTTQNTATRAPPPRSHDVSTNLFKRMRFKTVSHLAKAFGSLIVKGLCDPFGTSVLPHERDVRPSDDLLVRGADVADRQPQPMLDDLRPGRCEPILVAADLLEYTQKLRCGHCATRGWGLAMKVM